MKKWYWKNGMAFLLAVAMLFTDVVPALADNDMGETEIPTYDVLSEGVSSSDLLISGPAEITWGKAEASGGDMAYRPTGSVYYTNEDDEEYSITFSWGIPADVSTSDLKTGTVSTSNLEAAQTVAQYFNTETPKAGETTRPITLTIDKNTSYKIIVDWDGSNTPDDNSYNYRETTYILDFSTLDYAGAPTPSPEAPAASPEASPEASTEPTAAPTATPAVSSGDTEKVKYPNGQIEAVGFEEISEVTAFQASATTLMYVSDIPLTYLNAAKYGKTDITKGYPLVAVKITAPDKKAVRADIDKTTVDGTAWAQVENVDGYSFIKVIEVPAADKDGKIANKEIKVDWAGKGSVTYTLDFSNVAIGKDSDYPDTVFAAPAKLAIVSGYSKKLAVGAVQQLDVKITKSLPTDTVSVRFFSDSTNVNKDLLPYGIVQPTDTGKIKIYAQAIGRDGKPLAGSPKSKAITITATKVAGPKSLKVDKKALSDVSAKLTWKADDVYAGIDNVTVEYEAVAAATVKATAKDSIVLTDKQLGVAAGKSVKVSVNKIVKVDGKVVGTGTTKVKVTLAKVLPASIKFEKLVISDADIDTKAPTNALTIVYPDKSEVVYPKTKKGAAKLSVTFKSGNENIVKVDKKGKLTLKGMGTTTVTATVAIPGGKDLTASYVITVKAEIAKVSAKKKSLTMYIGDTKNLRDLLVYKTKKGKTISSASIPSEIVAKDIEAAFGAYFKVTSVSGGNVSGGNVSSGNVSGGNVSANDILITAVETTGKKGESFKITDKAAKTTDTATVKIIVKALKAPGKVKAVKGGAAGDSVTVTFNKSANANYYLAQLKVGKRKAGAPVVIPNSGSAKTITYTFKNLSPKTKYSVELTACYIAPKKVQTSKVVKATINTKKLAIKALEDIAKYDVSVGDLVSLKATVSGSDVTPGDVTGGNAAAAKDEWTVEVPCGEQVVISTVVDAYVRATGSDTLVWTISKADKKFVTVAKSKNTFDATLTGKKSSPIGKTATVTIKSKATGKLVGTLKIKVVPNPSYRKK